MKRYILHTRLAARPISTNTGLRYASARAAQRSNIPEEDLRQIEHESTKSHPDPGPDSQTARLIAEKSPYMVTTYARNPLALVKGEGCKVWDLEGHEYIDFNAGIAVSALGHGDMEIANVIFDQARQLIHSSNLFYSPWSWELAKLLIESTKSSGAMKDASKVFFANSGTEANEAAIKFARKHGQVMNGGAGKHKIMTFKNAFHGRTMGTLSATANEKYQAPFRPMVPGFEYAEFNDIKCVDALDNSYCAVMVEPVQGEGGIFAAQEDFLLALRKKCDEIGALLIFDEIQCGLGRSGKLWAHSWFDSACHPDIMTMAKPLANGVPIGATMVTEKVADAIKIGDHGTTFGGNPLACRVGHHVLSRLSSPSLLANVKEQSDRCLAALHKIKDTFPNRIVEVRGRGLLLGMQMDSDPSPIVKFARERGLLLITAGNNTVRFVPPLVIDTETMDKAMGILSEAVREFVESSSSTDKDLSPNRPKEATG
ncbi:Acetylornithine aminotransferase,mitochondrial [Taphrina deformans PYCC 5710]|uniref:acetylornithine transaminase n=1 Tax=Taphrina deformans (strain PYCC 5710 / ATCC 11124 / CBS 356.35 / IMI 108563 / JCM 9778 / NBRC 8474) TaxID=1097556 RepID=R4X6V2_TAPDE|nr:Acetylornithine aminotransferase,mitochondrial [Taphrina deformans PYCC 5710]|eukprot:CCG80686.1 Acetylornithine aminotransferase,mitochondrial [Taphrina deformans PYCC 5710]